jgi:hypothetical protein
MKRSRTKVRCRFQQLGGQRKPDSSNIGNTDESVTAHWSAADDVFDHVTLLVHQAGGVKAEHSNTAQERGRGAGSGSGSTHTFARCSERCVVLNFRPQVYQTQEQWEGSRQNS